MQRREIERLKSKCNMLIDKLQELEAEEKELDARILYLADRKKFLSKKRYQSVTPWDSNSIKIDGSDRNSKVKNFLYPTVISDEYRETEAETGSVELIKIDAIQDIDISGQEIRIIEAARNECTPIYEYALTNNEIYQIVGELSNSSISKAYEKEEVVIKHVTAANVSLYDIFFLFIKIGAFLLILVLITVAMMLIVSEEAREAAIQFLNNNFIS